MVRLLRYWQDIKNCNEENPQDNLKRRKNYTRNSGYKMVQTGEYLAER